MPKGRTRVFGELFSRPRWWLASTFGWRTCDTACRHRRTRSLTSILTLVYDMWVGAPPNGALRMSRTDKRKQSLYFPEDMLREIQVEANRQDRSLSWIVQQAWRLARAEIMRFPSVNDVAGEEDVAGRRE